MKKERVTQFAEGVWYAIQELALMHGQPDYAIFIAKGSGIPRKVFERIQKKTDYENERMENLVLRKL